VETEIFFDTTDTPVGALYLGFEAQALTALTFTPVNKTGQSRTSVSEHAIREIDAYFAGKLETFSIRIKFLSGTTFQKAVWNALASVPYGETQSYKWLAEKIGRYPASSRAIGQALKMNPIPIIVPCHRIVRSDHGLGGYSGGLARKEFLLQLESQKHRKHNHPAL
jgi:methylated-DNA-[protein]-cysteine S-methyltransferase